MENSDRLTSAVEQAKLEQEIVIEKLNSKLKEYDQLDELLSSFTDKRTHEAMIPISKSNSKIFLNRKLTVFKSPSVLEDLLIQTT